MNRNRDSGGGIGKSTKNIGLDGCKDESMSPQNENTNKGKQDIKSEDIKKEMDDSENGMNIDFGGKNAESMVVKKELKTEPMDTENSNNDAMKEEMQIKEEPMSPSAIKSEKKSVVPEPISSTSTDKKITVVYLNLKSYVKHLCQH